MSEIIIENLRYRYPHAKKLALDGLNFSVEKGEFIGIIGENGAGKTTTIGCILNTITKDSGTVKLFGQEMSWKLAVILKYFPCSFVLLIE